MEKLINLEKEYLKKLQEAKAQREKFLSKVDKHYFNGLDLKGAMEVSKGEM